MQQLLDVWKRFGAFVPKLVEHVKALKVLHSLTFSRWCFSTRTAAIRLSFCPYFFFSRPGQCVKALGASHLKSSKSPQFCRENTLSGLINLISLSHLNRISCHLIEDHHHDDDDDNDNHHNNNNNSNSNSSNNNNNHHHHHHRHRHHHLHPMFVASHRHPTPRQGRWELVLQRFDELKAQPGRSVRVPYAAYSGAMQAWDQQHMEDREPKKWENGDGEIGVRLWVGF